MILQIMLTYLYFYLLAFFPCAFEYISCPYISFEIRVNYNRLLLKMILRRLI